ncbi:MAG TPA: hypothetical protein VFD70_29670 [Anaerolineae bacterium]|nr:hypothetical protein [Anaerolineae bacterium]
MSESRNYADAFGDILENAHKAQQFVAGVEYKEFALNEEKRMLYFPPLLLLAKPRGKFQ